MTSRNTKNKNKALSLTANKSPAARRLDTGTGFYSKVLDEAEALDFEAAAGVEGLDEEITLLRIKIKALAENDPDNIRLMMAAANILAKLVKTRYSMNKKQEKNLGEAIRNIIKDIGVPLGVAVLNKKL